MSRRVLAKHVLSRVFHKNIFCAYLCHLDWLAPVSPGCLMKLKLMTPKMYWSVGCQYFELREMTLGTEAKCL